VADSLVGSSLKDLGTEFLLLSFFHRLTLLG
jgi:hypothetical protein